MRIWATPFQERLTTTGKKKQRESRLFIVKLLRILATQIFGHAQKSKTKKNFLDF